MSEVQETNNPTNGPGGEPSDQLELRLPDESSAPKDLALWAGVLALLALVAYWPATNGKFLWRDDVVSANAWVSRPTGLKPAWTMRWQLPDQYPFPMYQPVLASAYWLEYRLGGHADPTGPATAPPDPTPLAFHLANLIFHAGGAVLLWLILRELLMPGGWIIAAIFALHPLNAEPVSWIAEQAWPLGGLLFFGSAYLYLQFVKQRELDKTDRAGGGAGVDPVLLWGFYSGAVLAFVLALLTNPATAPLPVALILVLWWRKRLISQDNLLLLPLLVLVAILWLSTGDLHWLGDRSLWHQGWQAQLAAIGSGLFCCLRVIVPISLKVFHNQWAADQWWLGAIVIAVWGGLSGVFWSNRRRWGRGLFAVAIIFGLIQICSLNWFDADRLAVFTDASSYLASVPVIAIAVVLIIELLSQARLPGTLAQVALTTSAIFLVLFGGVTWARAHVFENPVAFWQDAVRKNPQSSFSLAALAEELRLRAIEDGAQGDTHGSQDDLAASLDAAQQAVAADPLNAVPQRTWANALVLKGDVKSALPHFRQAVTLDPNNLKTLSEYGSALDAIGMFKEAVTPLVAALRQDASNAMAHRLLGVALGGLGNESRAIRELDLSLELDPNDLGARQDLAEQQAKAGKLSEAIKNYALVLADKSNMGRADLFVDIAKIKERQYDFQSAVTYFQIAQRRDPDNAELKKWIEVDTAKAKAQAATRPTTQISATQPATTQAAKP